MKTLLIILAMTFILIGCGESGNDKNERKRNVMGSGGAPEKLTKPIGGL